MPESASNNAGTCAAMVVMSPVILFIPAVSPLPVETMVILSTLASGAARALTISAEVPARRGRVQLQPDFLFNPGLVDSWFIVTGVLGLLLILNSSLVASAAMVREREAGTIEQLLMSPASTTEIIVAKIAPLFLLLTMMMLVAVAVILSSSKFPSTAVSAC